MTPNQRVTPVRHLSAFDATCVIVGIVVGAMIFKAPAWVAANTGSAAWMMLAWLLGGFLCLCGALCYAELATTYPNVGGEYVSTHIAVHDQVEQIVSRPDLRRRDVLMRVVDIHFGQGVC